ncbi:hypothetical protein CFR73_14510 [Novacetimonas maltaceti]|uniref:Uncharacterized protein n=1 Tax=Novacetimonas maltaceti TaxID=1203393 RepID=A0A2S3VY77_9PROT|nr:hypothetical protein [Novacetimonas maltaceti]POF61576.1 hypothetical protein KMAL_27950 [Novacetimonas maltaceti]PYD58600.1 hypothetical protein CFR73_14510 [Novacetimonas maltaceti]
MGLQDIVLATATVTVSDGVQFAVRGLAPYDVAVLYTRYQSDMTDMFRRLTSKTGAGETVDLETDIVMQAPELVSALITLASNTDPIDDASFQKAVAIAKQLPLGAQMDALEKIGELTFSSDMPPEKFVRLIVTTMRRMTATIQAQTPTTPLN